ncbi:hypothetical protein OSB04_007194 [Centaurea solstitialis]|uniref:Reverse transcriptase domain-containing protein n=1 Tax=Centaurea solstitialis TaxID=347529 RepID=A0AA38TJF6_9ASTR|nr:hypothetical protein OSB04_007194 [Centaurea solstitialis]
MKIISLNIRGLGDQIKKEWIKELCKKEAPCLIGIRETKLKEISIQSAASLWGLNDGDFDFCEAVGNSGGLLTMWNKNVFHGQFVVKEKNFLAVIGKWEKKDGLIGFLVSSSFGELWKHVSARTLERKWSDHTPILLTDKLDDFGPIPFKFYDIWLNEDSVEKLRVKEALKAWRKGGWGEIDKEVVIARQEVRGWEVKKDVSKLEDADREKWIEARKKWKALEEKHVAMARQRAKLKWAKEGDENTKLFHVASKLRERRNRIQGLNIQGTWSENPEEIKKFVFEFFKKKFEKQNNSSAKLRSTKLKRISEEEASLLETKFTEEEVWSALIDCGNNKSPGPDGFTTGFLKKFWGLIKGDLMAALDWFWEKKELSNGCNSSFVSLIPKNTSPIGLNDFRPISLVGILYKVISKVLAERMKSVLVNVISNVQSAFLKGRSILDGILVANETISYLKSSRKKGLIFKVDFEKAYDSVSWEFLLDLLEQMGFGRKWRKWVGTCLKSSRISILVNGSPTEEFSMEKGIRQGDPMAPFLFLVVAKGMHVMVEEAIKKGLFKGLKVGNGGVTLSHLQYADDVVFFGEWGTENIVNLVKLLKCFYEVSGLKVNINKCNIFGIGVPEEDVLGSARVVECGSGSLPFTYLGLPVGVSMEKVAHWEKVIIKFKNKLSSWKAKWLSFGGRLSLVKSVLSSLPLYYFSLFQAPVSVIKSLESVRSNFFWGGGYSGGCEEPKRGRAWVKWDRVVESFDRGGLNVGGLREMNWSLIGKWWWRFFKEKSSLWRSIIQSIYGEKGGLELGAGVRSFTKDVGNGRSTKFWEDRWVGGEVLKEKFSRLYNLETCKEVLVGVSITGYPPIVHGTGTGTGGSWNQGTGTGTANTGSSYVGTAPGTAGNRFRYWVLVENRGSVVGSEWIWKWNWRRIPFGREVSELEELCKWLENFKPVSSWDDKCVWLLDPLGGFLVKALRTILGVKMSRMGEGGGRGEPTRWVKSIPSKVNVFFWKAKLERLPCRALLDKYGIDLDSTLCPRCNCEVESVQHALFSCEKVKNLWSLVGRWWNLDVSSIASLDDLLSLAVRSGANKKASALWEATIRSFAYMIWSDRNKEIFNNQRGDLCENLITFQRRIFEWLSQRCKDFHQDWRLWLSDPMSM